MLLSLHSNIAKNNATAKSGKQYHIEFSQENDGSSVRMWLEILWGTKHVVVWLYLRLDHCSLLWLLLIQGCSKLFNWRLFVLTTDILGILWVAAQALAHSFGWKLFLALSICFPSMLCMWHFYLLTFSDCYFLYSQLFSFSSSCISDGGGKQTSMCNMWVQIK